MNLESPLCSGVNELTRLAHGRANCSNALALSGASSDAELVSAVVQGSQCAASLIWHRHAPCVRAMLQRTLGRDHEIDDLVQEVFIGFVKSASRLQDPTALRSYLVGIAFRAAAMEIRRRKVRRRVVLTRTGDVPEAMAVSGEPDAHRALFALYQILDTLSTQERLVFIARHVEGWEIEETARALKLSKATVWRAGKASLERVVERARRSALLAGYVSRNRLPETR